METTVRDIVARMTPEEKVSLCSGADYWRSNAVEQAGVPVVAMCDGPHGLRKPSSDTDLTGSGGSIETVCYPSASALAASFDLELLERLGTALGRECQSEQVDVLLGPGVNMKRSPLCGRNFEYFSEDPYLAGKLATAYIRGLQGQGVAACVKHFAANNQETDRLSCSSNLSERTLHEIYLPAFEAAVKEGGVRSIMCAYNAVNGIFCSVNHQLITEILRERWGFQGLVVTDWGAGKDPVQGLQAGLDLTMPGGYSAIGQRLLAALEQGELDAAQLDRAVESMVRFVLECQSLRQPGVSIDRSSLAALSTQMAAECAVLLKNDGMLPLDKRSNTAFIGQFAADPRYQGSGSSRVNTGHVIGAAEASSGLSVTYAQGYWSDRTDTDPKLLAQAVKAARDASVAVVFAGLPDSFETEGVDRIGLDMPANQNELIEAVAAANPNTVVVLHGGAPMLTPWIDRVRGVLCMHLGGKGVGEAAVRLLYGDVNPSGKLAETWPRKLGHTPACLNYPGVNGRAEYAEGIYIGYRYYDKKEMEVQFPFGFGLSYTQFCYRDMALSRDEVTDAEVLTVTCHIKNTGLRAGKEAVQLYVKNPPSEVGRPIRELRAFQKVSLEPGEEKSVEFTLDSRAFAYYEERIHDWYVESGTYEVEIAASSRDIRLSAAVQVRGTRDLPYHYTPQSPVRALGRTAEGRVLLDQLTRRAGEGQDAQRAIMKMSLESLTSFGGISREQLDGMIRQLNHEI